MVRVKGVGGILILDSHKRVQAQCSGGLCDVLSKSGTRFCVANPFLLCARACIQPTYHTTTRTHSPRGIARVLTQVQNSDVEGVCHREHSAGGHGVRQLQLRHQTWAHRHCLQKHQLLHPRTRVGSCHVGHNTQKGNRRQEGVSMDMSLVSRVLVCATRACV
jgi:hypothetical protein